MDKVTWGRIAVVEAEPGGDGGLQAGWTYDSWLGLSLDSVSQGREELLGWPSVHGIAALRSHDHSTPKVKTRLVARLTR